MAAEVLGAVRREKTANKRSMRARVALLTVTRPPATLAAVEAARGDIVDAGGVDELVVVGGRRAVGGRWSWPTRPDPEGQPDVGRPASASRASCAWGRLPPE